MNIAILGDGNVGSALRRGLERAGHAVTAVGNEPLRIREAALAADVVFLAVPFGAVDDVLRTLGGAADGKVLVDVTNAIGPNGLALGYTTSGAEELQRKAPAARVVKAFNTAFASTMEFGQARGEKLAAFVAGDDAGAKSTVMELASDIGFDAVDAGPLANARLLEPMAMQNIQLGYGLGMGTDIGIRLVH